MLPFLFLLIIVFCIVMSLRTLFAPYRFNGKYISWESFLYLLFIYSTVLLGFGLIYFILFQSGLVIFLEGGQIFTGNNIDSLLTSFYFSGVTLLSVGYGDVTPIGIARVIALIEGLIGYTIPASFVVRTIVDIRRERA